MTLTVNNLLLSNVFIEKDCYHKIASYVQTLAPSHVFIVTDSIVGPLYSGQLQHCLQSLELLVSTLEIPAGESSKTRKTKEILEDRMLQLGATRQACILALGGGVVLDVAGFLAATYARGVPLILVPTSLLAMVDAGIGGKTGVNTPYGKNLIGCIYQPKAIYIDSNFLTTLPQPELKNGIVEMIKHALILDRNYFEFLEKNTQQILLGEPSILDEAISQSVAIKAAVVAIDEHEVGKRRLLNFGHTIGHAIEAASSYTVSHGRAVALGILAEGYISVEQGFLQKQELDRIKNLFISFAIDLHVEIDQNVLYTLMSMDKKSNQGKPRIVFLKAIGECLQFDGEYCCEVNEHLLDESLNYLLLIQK